MAAINAALWRCCATIVLTLHLSSGYSNFPGRIPNGQSVPNPCKNEEIWIGVGHKLIGGSGARNSFGLDFAANGLTWTKALCEKDSDHDGRTNGQELGDPNCTWSQGMSDPTGYTISHPGICEPWNDPKCLDGDQSWVMEACQPSEFKCDAIKSPGVQNMTLRIPRTSVPVYETTYMCQIFNIPNDTDYHIIATTPNIDNTNILHHAVMFGCTEDVEESTTPFKCGMLPNNVCRSIISLWGPGSAGECVHSTTGFRMGANGFKKIALQLHWNNPGRRGDYFDESGMTMYFTSNLRPNDAGILTTGQEQLLIPPRESLVRVEAVYPGDCSQRELSGNIYITAAVNHMHYLGKRQFLELYRGGVKIRDIAADPYYNYDNPKFNMFDDPIEVRPGDELKTRCEYSSTGLSHTTMFGWATSDEMCYSFITYYPKQSASRDMSTSIGSIPKCRLYSSDTYAGCEWKTFPDLTDLNLLQVYSRVKDSCKLFEACSQNCYDAIQAAKEYKCMQGDIWSSVIIYGFFGSLDGVEFIMRMQSCDCGVPTTIPPTPVPITTEQSTCDWPGLLQPDNDHPLFSLYANVIAKCIATGTCLKECIPAVEDARGHRCFQGAEWHYGRRYLQQSLNSKALEFMLDFESCNCQLLNSSTSTTPAPTTLNTNTDTTTPAPTTLNTNTDTNSQTTIAPPVGVAPVMSGFNSFWVFPLLWFVCARFIHTE